MYCGTNKIALESLKQIGETFIKLMNVKQFSEISVAEICREAGLSRQTFYTLYESKENIIVRLLQYYNFMPEISAENSEKPVKTDLSAFCSRFAFYLFKNIDFLTLLEKNNILYLLYDSFYATIISCPNFYPEKTQSEKKYAASFMSAGFTGIVKTYIEEGKKKSQQEIENIITNAFSGNSLN